MTNENKLSLDNHQRVNVNALPFIAQGAATHQRVISKQAIGSLSEVITQIIESAKARSTAEAHGKKNDKSVVRGVEPFPGIAAGAVSPADFIDILTALKSKGVDEIIKTAISQIGANKATAQTKNVERMKQIDENIDKISKSKNMGFWQKVLGIIATVVIMAVGIVTAVLTAGATLAPLIAGAIACTAFVLQQTGALSAIGTAIGKSFGEKDGQVGSLVFSLLISIAVAAIGMVFTGGASSASAIASTASLIGKMTSIGGKVASTTSQVIGSSMQIASSSYSYQVNMSKADIQDIKAMLTKLNFNDDVMRDLIEKMTESFSTSVQIIDDVIDEKMQSDMIRSQVIKG